MPGDYTPRLSIALDEQTFADLQRCIPWGDRRRIFSIIVEDVIRLSKTHGHLFLGAIMSRSLKLEDFLKVNTGEKDETGAPKEELLRDYLRRADGVNKGNKSKTKDTD